MEGSLEASQITAAFRRLAKTAHPDAGGRAPRKQPVALKKPLRNAAASFHPK